MDICRHGFCYAITQLSPDFRLVEGIRFLAERRRFGLDNFSLTMLYLKIALIQACFAALAVIRNHQQKGEIEKRVR